MEVADVFDDDDPDAGFEDSCISRCNGTLFTSTYFREIRLEHGEASTDFKRGLKNRKLAELEGVKLINTPTITEKQCW